MSIRIRSAVSAVTLAVLPMAASWAGDLCPSVRERAAFHVRLLQTELMVAALSCGRPEYVGLYNAFVERSRPELVGHARVLKSYFARQYGAGRLTRLDAFVTDIANQASHRSMASPEFCASAGPLLASVAEAQPEQVAELSALQLFAQEFRVEGCKAPVRHARTIP